MYRPYTPYSPVKTHSPIYTTPYKSKKAKKKKKSSKRPMSGVPMVKRWDSSSDLGETKEFLPAKQCG